MSGAQDIIDTRALEIASRADSKADRAQEFSEARLGSHEALCAERYSRIAEQHQDIKDSLKANTSAIGGIYNRMWVAAGAVILVLLGITAWLYQSIEHKRISEHQEFRATVKEILREVMSKDIKQ